MIYKNKEVNSNGKPTAVTLTYCIIFFILCDPALAGDKAGSGTNKDGNNGPGPGNETKRIQVSTKDLGGYARRLKLAADLRDINASIYALEQLLKDLAREKQRWLNERQNINQNIASVQRSINKINGKIKKQEALIVAASITSAGIVSPELLAVLEAMKVKKRSLKQRRKNLKNSRNKLNQKIDSIDNLTRETKVKIQLAKQKRKRWKVKK